MKAETRFTKQGTRNWIEVQHSAQIIPAQRGMVLLRFIEVQSGQSLDIKMTKEECQDLIEQLQWKKSDA